MAGYTPVAALGRVPMSEVESVRVGRLLRETVNEVVLDHAALVDDIADLRDAVAGCLGFSIARDDVRARELISTLQRHSGREVELPSDAAMTSVFLDAMQAARVPAEERTFFRFIGSCTFYSGAGAGIEDVVRWSTQEAHSA
jgi:hypothetical protein